MSLLGIKKVNPQRYIHICMYASVYNIYAFNMFIFYIPCTCTKEDFKFLVRIEKRAFEICEDDTKPLYQKRLGSVKNVNVFLFLILSSHSW